MTVDLQFARTTEDGVVLIGGNVAHAAVSRTPTISGPATVIRS
jgi:hypothetical protein